MVTFSEDRSHKTIQEIAGLFDRIDVFMHDFVELFKIEDTKEICWLQPFFRHTLKF